MKKFTLYWRDSKREQPKIRTAKTLACQIEACKARMAKERDKLRDLVSDAEALRDNYDTALDDLDRAADAISQYV